MKEKALERAPGVYAAWRAALGKAARALDCGLAAVGRAVLLAYKTILSPVLPAACRFHPTCSAYGAEALRQHGALRGGFLALRRLGRCHPFSPGGIDPVPPRRHG